MRINSKQLFKSLPKADGKFKESTYLFNLWLLNLGFAFAAWLRPNTKKTEQRLRICLCTHTKSKQTHAKWPASFIHACLVEKQRARFIPRNSIFCGKLWFQEFHLKSNMLSYLLRFLFSKTFASIGIQKRSVFSKSISIK